MPPLTLLGQIEEDLAKVELELAQFVQGSVETLNESGRDLLSAGGKRLRPAFVLLSGKLCGGRGGDLISLAAAIELIHMATLVHDDVIDDSRLRRGHPTVFAKRGSRFSIHVGDFLFARSLLLLSRYDWQPLISAILSEVSVKMCEGEILQIATVGNSAQTLRDYLYRIRCKTALLLSASCEVGAVAAGAQERDRRTLKAYGYYLGMAFQITDDLLDFVAVERDLGKPVGEDIRQGILTLPAIYALRNSPDRDRLAALVERAEKTDRDIALASELIIASGGLKFAQSIAYRYACMANECLEDLPAHPAREALSAMTSFVTERQY